MEDPIRKLSRQLEAAQSTLKELQATTDFNAFTAQASACDKRDQLAYISAVRSLQDRRARTQYFGDSRIFGEPAWDILLDLYVHEFDEEAMSLGRACISSRGSRVTAELWLKLLEEMGLIVLKGDRSDGRKTVIRLTPKGKESMTRYLTTTSVG